MSAECNKCGNDIVYPEGTWPLGECPVCSVETELAARRKDSERVQRVRALADRYDHGDEPCEGYCVVERHAVADDLRRALLDHKESA